jgi:ribosomal peptide maturation radical SAM protein 1
VFARAAFGLPPLGHNADRIPEGYRLQRAEGLWFRPVPASRARSLEPLVGPWTAALGTAVAQRAPHVVGFTLLANCVAASYALAARIKQERPDVVTAFGGPACAGPMAEGILSLGPAVDVVFAGEAEHAFVEFLSQVRAGKPVRRGVVASDRDVDLSSLPLPDFGGYYEQMARFVPGPGAPATSLLYETCRGCWWGAARRCAFCGFDSHGRATLKDPDIVLRDLEVLRRCHPGTPIAFTDPSIHPASHASVVPRLARAVPPHSLQWTVRPDLTLAEAAGLKSAGVWLVSAGIESFSTTILARIRKGTTARQSVDTLRHCRSAGILAMWNLMGGVPGDRLEEYDEIAKLLPLVAHLQPPTMFVLLEIVRFSPYFCAAAEYGLSNLRPAPVYRDVFPSHADVDRLAYGFVADYPSESLEQGDRLAGLCQLIEDWRAQWRKPGIDPPRLSIRPLAGSGLRDVDGPFVLDDTRGLPGTDPHALLTRDEATAALTAAVPPTPGLIRWALARKLGVMIDGEYVPLATADPRLVLRMEADHGAAAGGDTAAPKRGDNARRG